MERVYDCSASLSPDYRGATIGFNKREGRGRLYVSYTMSQLRRTVFNGANNQWGDIPGRDVIPLQLRVRLQYNRLFRNDVTGSFENYRAARGYNPGNNINDPGDDRELRLPAIQDLNVQARLNLAPLIGHKLSLYADALNIMNLRTPTAYGANDRQNFGVETGWMAPFRVRLGMDYKF